MAVNLETTLEMLGTGVDWTTVPAGPGSSFYKSQRNLNPDNFDGATYRFEICVTNADATTCAVKLIDTSNSNAVLATITVGASATAYSYRTTFTAAWSGDHVLAVAPASRSGTSTLHRAFVTVAQVAATKTIVEIPLVVEGRNTSASDAYNATAPDTQTATTAWGQVLPDKWIIWHYISSAWSTIAGLYVEATLASTAGKGGYVGLTADGTNLIGTAAGADTIGTTIATYKGAEFTAASLTTATDYYGGTQCKTGSTLYVHKAHLCIRLTSLSACEVYEQVGGYWTGTLATPGYFHRKLVTSANWPGGIASAYFESTGHCNESGANQTYLGYNTTDNFTTMTEIAATDINWNSATKARQRVGPATLTDGWRVCWKSHATTATQTVTGAFLVYVVVAPNPVAGAAAGATGVFAQAAASVSHGTATIVIPKQDVAFTATAQASLAELTTSVPAGAGRLVVCRTPLFAVVKGGGSAGGLGIKSAAAATVTHGGSGTTWTVGTRTVAAVQAAINGSTSGDTVYCPGGTPYAGQGTLTLKDGVDLTGDGIYNQSTHVGTWIQTKLKWGSHSNVSGMLIGYNAVGGDCYFTPCKRGDSACGSYTNAHGSTGNTFSLVRFKGGRDTGRTILELGSNHVDYFTDALKTIDMIDTSWQDCEFERPQALNSVNVDSNFPMGNPGACMNIWIDPRAGGAQVHGNTWVRCHFGVKNGYHTSTDGYGVGSSCPFMQPASPKPTDSTVGGSVVTTANINKSYDWSLIDHGTYDNTFTDCLFEYANWYAADICDSARDYSTWMGTMAFLADNPGGTDLTGGKAYGWGNPPGAQWVNIPDRIWNINTSFTRCYHKGNITGNGQGVHEVCFEIGKNSIVTDCTNAQGGAFNNQVGHFGNIRTGTYPTNHHPTSPIFTTNWTGSTTSYTPSPYDP